jgi:hypothetical protein
MKQYFEKYEQKSTSSFMLAVPTTKRKICINNWTTSKKITPIFYKQSNQKGTNITANTGWIHSSWK